MTVTQEFVAYCASNRMPSDSIGSAVFYASRRKIRTGQTLSFEEWNDLLDFVSPDVPSTACSLSRPRYEA